MADVHQLITLGIGTPSDIEHFILVGLSATGPVSLVDAEPIVIEVAAAGRSISFDAIGRSIDVPAGNRVIEVTDRP